MLDVKIVLVDGSGQDYQENERILKELKQLRGQGYEGKDLINKLITDDWGAPPRYIVISGRTTDGKTVNERIVYD